MIVCLTETWLSVFDQPFMLPTHACYSAFRPLCDGPGCHSGGASVCVLPCLYADVEIVKQAEDASYLWLKHVHVVLGCPEVYLCVCFMPDRKSQFAAQLQYHELQMMYSIFRAWEDRSVATCMRGLHRNQVLSAWTLYRMC